MIKIFYIIHCSFFLVSGNHLLPRNDQTGDEDVLQGMFKRLTSIESQYQHQTVENVQLRKSLVDLQSKVSTLHDENQQLQSQIKTLQSRDQTRDREMKDLQRQVANFLKRDQEREKEMKDLFDHIDKLEEHDDAVRSENDGKDDKITQNRISERATAESARQIKRAENEMNVAFFSALGNHLQHLGVNQNVVFDHVITNVGNAYNNHAGDFRAPVAGTYVFSVTLMAYVSHTTHYNLAKNGSAVANLYVRGTESPYASSSMTAVLELKKGDDVAIRNVDQDEYLHGSYYSTFSGFLLNQDYSSPVVIGK